MDQYNKKREYKPVQSIERIFQVLEILALNPEGLSLLALSEKTGLPSSTLHRLLHTLYALGYTEWRYSSSAPYKLTLRLFEYGSGLVEHRPFVQMAHPLLDRLSEELDLSAYIFVPQEPHMVCIVCSTRSSLMNGPHRGSCVPMWCTASGKCFLSLQPEEEVLKLWNSRGPSLYGPNAPVSSDSLLEDLTEVRQNGYCLCKEEFRVGLSSLSIPLIRQDDVITGALSLCGPPFRFLAGDVQYLSEKLKKYGKSLMSDPSLY